MAQIIAMQKLDPSAQRSRRHNKSSPVLMDLNRVKKGDASSPPLP